MLAGTDAAMAADGPVLVSPAGTQVTLSGDERARIPVIPLTVSFETEHGRRKASFDGPLLWDVLIRAGAIDAAKPRNTTREIVTITGADGYVAVLAVGEISPEFEGKQVILAEKMDGKPLDPSHLRVVVPPDRRGGRSVRDVTRIEVVPARPASR